jgi:aerobic-type carbon monoxide dehydrogenase small subunit (CoxS/CutS family)
MIISAAALLARDAAPDEAAIRDALAGNLCRCGVYGRAIRAVQKTAKMRGVAGGSPPAMNQEGSPPAMNK